MRMYVCIKQVMAGISTVNLVQQMTFYIVNCEMQDKTTSVAQSTLQSGKLGQSLRCIK